MTNHDIMTRVCQKCGKEYQISVKSFRQRERRGNPDYCKECMKWDAAERIKQTKENMTPERKAEYSRRLSEANLNYWKNLQGDELEKRKQTQQELGKRLQELRKDPEFVKEVVRRRQATMQAMPDEDKARHKAKMAEAMRRHHASKTPEQRKQFSEQIKAGMAKMTDQEKIEMKDAWRTWWNQLSPDKKLKRMQAASERVAEASGRNIIENALSARFVQGFNNSILANEFTLESEYPSIVGSEFHRWDFGIYDSAGKIIMVVDLDGAYYHADDCDYDGLYSREELDEKRALTVPDGAKWMIIQEYNFAECFAELIKQVYLNYDEFIDQIFKQCRRIPFPSPKYSDTDLVKSFESLRIMSCDDEYHKSLGVNTRLGDRLIQHFHESIWSAHCSNKPSPREAWYNDDLLKKVIKNRTIYQTTLNPNKILQGFNVSKIAPKVSVFSAGRAKMIIHRYLDDFDTIFDPFSGFSGRMLGAISLGKDYLGQDISEIHVRESNNMIKFLRQVGFDINAEIEAHDILSSYGTYPCLFTCPPYGDKEQWLEVPPDRRTCDDWVDICLEHFKCRRYVFVVDHTEKYKDYIVDDIRNKSHMGQNCEYIIVIDK